MSRNSPLPQNPITVARAKRIAAMKQPADRDLDEAITEAAAAGASTDAIAQLVLDRVQAQGAALADLEATIDDLVERCESLQGQIDALATPADPPELTDEELRLGEEADAAAAAEAEGRSTAAAAATAAEAQGADPEADPPPAG